MKSNEELIHDTLKQVWGYEAFRSVQQEVILSVMEGRDTLAMMPTGGGKSLTYQVPTLACKGLCLVITPLVALMQDQVERLRSMHINAVAIHAGMSTRQIDIALDNCVYGGVRFLYLSPERIATECFRLRLERMPVTLIAVDEAHCISQWGYDFRPSYLRIGELRKRLPKVPILALTASATKIVQQDIMEKLCFTAPHIVRSSFARPNLAYCVRACEDRYAQLIRLLRGVDGSGIVYVRRRETAEELAHRLQSDGFSAAPYHAGMPNAERSNNQRHWINGDLRIMVATNAFGMGIDKSDVRFVVHYAMPDSLESYYQEAGRAGRDGKRAYALLITHPDDTSRFEERFKWEFPPLDEVKRIYDRLCSFLQIPIGEGGEQSFPFDIYSFCAREKYYEKAVTYAIKLLQLNEYITLIEPRERPPHIVFVVERDALYRTRVVHEDINHFVSTLLRMYGGLFSDYQAIDLDRIALWSGYTRQRVSELLKRLWQMRLIKYLPSNEQAMIYLNKARLPLEDLFIAPETYLARKERVRDYFERMKEYATNTELCRNLLIDRYFGGEGGNPCGVCDVCLQQRRTAKQEADQELLSPLGKQLLALLAEGALPHHMLLEHVCASPESIIDELRRLMHAGRICTDKQGNLKIR